MNPEDFLKSLVDYEKQPAYDYDLAKFERFLNQLNSPQDRLRNIIHIGGTKGKGTCAALLASCLAQSGYAVGQYTSPHLVRINERIKINDTPISNKDLAYYIEKIKHLPRRKHGARTFFETLTAIAFLHFVRRKTDFTILEVGLGGRLDATNLASPLISVLTRIGYDHTALLGNKLPQIAEEKAGIIKYHGKLFTIKQRPAVQQIINKKCRSRSCSLYFANDQHTIKITDQTIRGSNLRISGQLGTFSAFLPLPGIHQVENLLLVLAVITELRIMGFNIPNRALQKGIRQTKLRGRFEVVSKEPFVIFDGGHNRDSFEALHMNIKTLKIRNFYLIFGCSQGKDISYAVRHIFPKAQEIVLVRANNPRAMRQDIIYQQAKKYQRHMIIASSIPKAIDYVKTVAKKNIKIIITGSFYLWQSDW